MDKVKLRLFNGGTDSLTEIFQNISINMAFVKADYKQISRAGKCRDFLGDVPWANHFQRPYKIYGLSYDPIEYPMDRDVFRLSLKFPDIATKDRFIKNFYFITEMEKFAKVQESRLLETQFNGTLIIEADKVWQEQTWKVSLYTFYLKCISYPDPHNLPEVCVEQRYVKQYHNHEEAILKNIHDTTDFFQYVDPSDDESSDESMEGCGAVNDNHNNSGFISMLGNKYETKSKVFYSIMGIK